MTRSTDKPAQRALRRRVGAHRVRYCGLGVYSCTCPAWRASADRDDARTCEHIMSVRGGDEENVRVSAAMLQPYRPPWYDGVLDEGADRDAMEFA